MTRSPAPGGAHPRGTDPGDDLRPFRSVRAWVFDLDNTLYPLSSNLYAQIEDRIRAFIATRLGVGAEEAAHLQVDFHIRYGATLRGLMIEHGVSPDEFLSFVHDVDHSVVAPDPALAAVIPRLPGRRYILTNGSRVHAERVLKRVGIEAPFDGIFDIVWAKHTAKPLAAVYEQLVAETGATGDEVAIFEDLARNLAVPRQLGMTTVMVLPPGTRPLFYGRWDLESGADREADFLTEDLAGFLQAVLATLETP
ncbi:MAG: pyrimidine 5'-nucleotidase [Bauldia sp.]|nr:pyrimidine 5'-nucleotidase [Bauldia sp.]